MTGWSLMPFHESHVDCVFLRPICWILTVTVQTVAALTDLQKCLTVVLLIRGKKVEKIHKNAENYFHQMYSERIYYEEHLAETITKPNWRYPTASALCKQKCLGQQKMTLSGITPADICSLFQS